MEGRDGDARDLLRGLADMVSVEDLAAGWRTAQQVREWALDLCERVEGELNAGQFGEAVTEWLHGRQLMSGLFVLETLCERHWSPSSGARSALNLLFQCQMFAALDALVPGCQWNVLEIPGGARSSRTAGTRRVFQVRGVPRVGLIAVPSWRPGTPRG
ncbi:hypothetical protein ACFVW1_00300 [Streptomyces olivochromogenes]|uniref:hypothetical protein n=1 Tax=Streptomyces olivochromogenes TaxID=1963 RepID=UPI0036DA4146